MSKKLHYGYIVVAGVILLGLIQGMVINTVSLFYTPVSTDFGISLSSFGLFATITTLSTAVLMSPAGSMFAKFDTKVSLTVCVLIYAVCNFVRSVATSIWIFHLTGIVQGFSSAMFIFIIVPGLVQNWFAVKQGTMIGICAATQGLGASLFSAIGGVMIESVGWRACYVLWTVVTLVIGLPVALFVIKKSPEEKGLKPVGWDQVTEKSGGSGAVNIQTAGLSAKEARKTLAFVLLAAFAGIYGFANVFNGYLNTYITEIGYTATIAGTVSSIVMLGLTVGKVINGMICDKSLRADIILCCGCGAGAFLMFFVFGNASVALIMAASLLFGWCYSSLNVIAPVLTRQLFGQKDFTAIWANMGTVENLIGAIGYTAWGWVIAGVGFSGTMLVLVAMYLVVMACALGAMAKTKSLQKRWS